MSRMQRAGRAARFRVYVLYVSIVQSLGRETANNIFSTHSALYLEWLTVAACLHGMILLTVGCKRSLMQFKRYAQYVMQ